MTDHRPADTPSATADHLCKNDERLRLAMDAADIRSWEIDVPSGAFTWADNEDPAIEFPIPDTVADLLEMVQPDDRAAVRQTFEQAMNDGGEFEIDYPLVETVGDGTKWLSSAGTAITTEDDSVARVVGVTQDITERKQREQQLERQREQIEQLKDRLLATSPTGILMINGAGEVTLANDRAAEILGISHEELVGLDHNAPIFDLVDLNGDSILDERLPFEQLRTTDDAIFDIEVGVTRPDGEHVWLSMNATPLYDADEPTETVVALEDITDHKQLTEALERLNDASREMIDADAGGHQELCCRYHTGRTRCRVRIAVVLRRPDW